MADAHCRSSFCFCFFIATVNARSKGPTHATWPTFFYKQLAVQNPGRTFLYEISEAHILGRGREEMTSSSLTDVSILAREREREEQGLKSLNATSEIRRKYSRPRILLSI